MQFEAKFSSIELDFHSNQQFTGRTEVKHQKTGPEKFKTQPQNVQTQPQNFKTQFSGNPCCLHCRIIVEKKACVKRLFQVHIGIGIVKQLCLSIGIG